jgi:folate-dependent tRNA-U54 methylase TrmFO/GidA
MDKVVKTVKERRHMSQAGLLDSAMRTLGQLAVSNDMTTRTLAGRALADIKRARQMVPMRRMLDKTSRL